MRFFLLPTMCEEKEKNHRKDMVCLLWIDQDKGADIICWIKT